MTQHFQQPNRFRIVGGAGLLVLFGVLAVGWASVSVSSAAAPRGRTVGMVIDFNDGIEKHFTRLAWRADMTVMDAMKLAARSRHGITMKTRGSGETTFLTQIDDVENEGGGTQARNWLFRVNGKRAQRGIGSTVLKPSDKIQWKFEKFTPDND